VDPTVKTNIEGAIDKLKKAMEGSDTEAIKTASEELMQTSHKLAETMYSQASEAGQAGGQAAGEAEGAAGGDASQTAQDEDVVDADFEEVRDNK